MFVRRCARESRSPGPSRSFMMSAYIQDRLWQIWRNTFIRLLVQALLISLTILLIVRWTLVGPIARMTDRIKRLRRGDLTDSSSLSREDLLSPLATEVTQMAESLSAARAAAEEEARLRQAAESLWTPELLKEHLRAKLQGRPLFVISNREPYSHVRKGKKMEWIVPASGLVTALEPVLKACGGTWIAHGSGDADREVVDTRARIRVPPEEPQYTAEESLAHQRRGGRATTTALPTKASGRSAISPTPARLSAPETGDTISAVNRKFAEAALQEIEGVDEPLILIQDYHFALLPRMIKDARPDARVALFWHIPWPNPESFSICPWQRELLHGMLGADLIGFHIQFHCNNFLETVDRALESRIDWEHFSVRRGNHRPW